jgi:hypothetical protein
VYEAHNDTKISAHCSGEKNYFFVEIHVCNILGNIKFNICIGAPKYVFNETNAANKFEKHYKRDI